MTENKTEENQSPVFSAFHSAFCFPTVVNGQIRFSGIPVQPIAAAWGHPVPFNQVSSIASKLTSHMSCVTSSVGVPPQTKNLGIWR